MIFLGLKGLFRRFLKDYARTTENLTGMLKKNETPFKWNEKTEEEFIELKENPRNIKMLALPNYEKKFMLRTDASNSGL